MVSSNIPTSWYVNNWRQYFSWAINNGASFRRWSGDKSRTFFIFMLNEKRNFCLRLTMIMWLLWRTLLRSWSCCRQVLMLYGLGFVFASLRYPFSLLSIWYCVSLWLHFLHSHILLKTESVTRFPGMERLTRKTHLDWKPKLKKINFKHWNFFHVRGVPPLGS